MTFRHIQCLHLIYDEVAWVLISSGTQVPPQIVLNPVYFSIFPFLMTMVQKDGYNKLNLDYECQLYKKQLS